MKALSLKVQVFILISLTLMTAWYYSNTISQTMPTLDLQINQLTFQARQEVYCLADNIYYEAAKEPEKGQLAVAFVTQNRVDKGFANSICGVVKQKVNGVCQFSWMCIPNLTKRDGLLYNEVLRLALNFYVNKENLRDPTHGSLFYHANYVNPGWKLKKTVTIGNHIFYNYKGTSI